MSNGARKFEDLYQAWKSFIESDDIRLSSVSKDYISNPHFEAIVKLGPEAVPYIIEKLETDESAHFLIHALEEIVHKKFTPEEIEQGQARYGVPLGNQGYAAMWRDWWRRQGSEKPG
ncbi:MAG TPA: hypothetical protein VLL54_20795 [Pyrinomonadaceae bacterium]|nr:hypothetical protein [Pyrinomonadaceae bacterium]